MPILAHSGLIVPPGDVPGVTPGGIGLADYTGPRHPPFKPSFLMAVSTISNFSHIAHSSALQMFAAAIDRPFRPGAPLIQTCTAVISHAFSQPTYDATYTSVAAITAEDARFINLPFPPQNSSAQLTQLYDTGGFQLDWRSQYDTIASHHTPYLAIGGLEDAFIGGFVRDPTGPMNDQFVPVGFDYPDLNILFTSSQLPGDPNAGPYARFQIGFCCSEGSFCHAFIDASQVGSPSRTSSFQHPNCGLQYYNPANPTELWGRCEYMGSAPGGFNIRWTDGLTTPPAPQIIFMALKGLGATVRTYSVPTAPQPAGLALQPIDGLNAACRAAIATSINQPASDTAYGSIRTAFGFGAENAPQPSAEISTGYVGTNGGGDFLGFSYASDALIRLVREEPGGVAPPIWDADANLTNWGLAPRLEWAIPASVSDRAAGNEYSLLLMTDKLGRVGGTVTGLVSDGLILQLDPGAHLLPVSEGGPFEFSADLDSGTVWALSVRQQPVGQVAALTGETGTIGAGGADTVAVVFTPHPGPDFSGADFAAADFLVDDQMPTAELALAGQALSLQLRLLSGQIVGGERLVEDVPAAYLARYAITGRERIAISPGIRRGTGISDLDWAPGSLVITGPDGKLIPRPAGSRDPMAVVDDSPDQGVGVLAYFLVGESVPLLYPRRGHLVNVCLAPDQSVDVGDALDCTMGGTVFAEPTAALMTCEGQATTGPGEFTYVKVAIA